MEDKNLFKNKEFSKLADNVGFFIEYWGFKSIQGKIWLLLFLSNQDYSTKELREIFGVSKGMMSLVLNELVEYRVLLPAGHGKYGVELFKANSNVLAAIFHVLKNRELFILSECLKSLDDLRKVRSSISDHYPIDNKRLSMLVKLVKYAHSALNKFFKLDETSWKKWKIFKS